MLKKWGNLGKDWDPASIKSLVNFSIRPDRVEELIQLIADDEEARDVVKTIYFQDIFPFTYDMWGLADINSNYSDPRYNVNDFKSGAIVAIEFQILSQNFKASKKVDAIKAYSFRLLEVFLVDDPMHSIILTLNKRRHGEDEWIVTSPQTKRTITSKNLLES